MYQLLTHYQNFYVEGPVDAFMLVWVIVHLVQAISGYLPDKCLHH